MAHKEAPHVIQSERQRGKNLASTSIRSVSYQTWQPDSSVAVGSHRMTRDTRFDNDVHSVIGTWDLVRISGSDFGFFWILDFGFWISSLSSLHRLIHHPVSYLPSTNSLPALPISAHASGCSTSHSAAPPTPRHPFPARKTRASHPAPHPECRYECVETTGKPIACASCSTRPCPSMSPSLAVTLARTKMWLLA